MHRTVVLASVDVVSAVTTDDLSRPTPCAGWNLSDLLTHMTVQHRGFAAAAHGLGADPRLMVKYRAQLERWVSSARAAGLDGDDLHTLVTSVLAEHQLVRAAGAGA